MKKKITITYSWLEENSSTKGFSPKFNILLEDAAKEQIGAGLIAGYESGELFLKRRTAIDEWKVFRGQWSVRFYRPCEKKTRK